MQLINHPFRLLIVGKSQSGKTTLAIKCIEYLIPQVNEVYVTSPTFDYQPAWNPIRSAVTLNHQAPEELFKALGAVIRGHETDDDHKAGTRIPVKRLLVCDDVSYEKAINQGNKGLFNGFAYNAVHWNLSMVVIVHKVANIGAGMKENCDGLVIFNTVEKEIKNIHETFGLCRTPKQAKNLIHQFIKKKIESNEDSHPFIFMDLKHGDRLYFKMKERLVIETDQE